MKTYKKVILIVIIVLGIFAGIWTYFNSPLAKGVHSNLTPSEVEYENLKSIALTAAKGEEPSLDENTSLEYIFNDKSFEVIVKKQVSWTATFYELKATFPMNKVNVGFVDGNVQETFAIDYAKGNYDYSPIEDKGTLAYISLVVAFSISLFLFMIFYWIPTEIIEMVRSGKRKKWRIEDFQ